VRAGRSNLIAMLITRIFNPPNGTILYHYCSVPSFHAILESGRIRFTDINMLNDAHEMHWGYSVFEEAVDKLLKLAQSKNLSNLDRPFFDKVDKIIGPLQARIHPFISCFSLEPDLLGQWRAYADDARGFAIGFDANALKHMPVTLLAVEYDRQKQVQEMMDALGATYMENEADGRSFGQKFFASCALIGNYMLAFKNPTFRDEREVRCLHVLNVQANERAMKLVDDGGLLGTKESVAGEEVRFRVQDLSLVAYFDMPFRRGFEATAIWPAPGFTDTELGVLMEPEVCHGATEVYAGV
jgi:hypothetical protein